METGNRSGDDPIERLQAGSRAHRRPQRTRSCPDENRLRLLLPGQVAPQEAESLLTHAAECDWCGMVLREATQDLSDPPTGEEEQLAGRARLADPVSRRELAERIVKRKQTGEKTWNRILHWLPAVSLAAVAVVGGVSYRQWTLGAAHTAHLLARAYTEHRQMELRLPGVEWGLERTQMSAASSSFEPRELMDAKSNISRAMDARPDDPRWLQLEGRAELLSGKDDAAIVDLARARSLRPADPTILVDLGTAYYQKAEKTSPDDTKAFSLAYDSFTEGLRLQPRDPTLLFDQALAAERIYAYTAAREAWEDYLKMDSNGDWAREARGHLDKVKKNLMGSRPTPQPPSPTH
jgi:cytochrome c-type biogenesis protein CcmH/NrfG